MHTPIPVIIGRAAPVAHASQVAAAVTALIVAAVIILVFKLAGKLLTPRKPRKSASPYATRGK